MKPTLYLRIAGIAIVTLALTMLAAALLTSQLIRVEQRQAVDQVLRRELAAFASGFGTPRRASFECAFADQQGRRDIITV